MTELRPEIVNYFNEIGMDRLQIAVVMAECELFRAYMMQKFNWFKSHAKDFELGNEQHIIETTWYRYYRDNGRLPKKLNTSKMLNETLTKQEIIDIIMEIYEDYKSKGYDLLNSNGPEEYNYCIPTDL